jgi:aspartate carbamoyltransferase regulatory subunit
MLTKSLPVAAIKSGTVLDHITAGQALKIIRILNLAKHKKRVSVGLNLPSCSGGLKDLIKVEDRELSEEEAGQVAVLAPKATINIIRDFEVCKKFQVSMPPVLENVIVCPNRQCISNHERMKSFFFVQRQIQETKLICKYCRNHFRQDDITEYRT